MPSIIKVDQIQSDTGTVNVSSNVTFSKSISGNLGQGVTPSSWNTFNVSELGHPGNSLFGQTGAVQAGLGTNAYYNSGWKYANSGSTSALYYQLAGVHTFVGADSGTAGNAVSYTACMRLSKDQTLALQGASQQTGTGITFPATQNPSTNPNTLDDYEEGTWTPTIRGESVTGTPVSGTGYYTKIGRFVYVSIRFENVARPGGGASGNAIIDVPFVFDSSLTGYSYPGVGLLVLFSGSSIANTCQSVRVNEGSQYFRIQYQSNLNTDFTNISINDLGPSSNYLRFSFGYFIP